MTWGCFRVINRQLMSKVIFQATTYVRTAGLERGRENTLLANQDGVIDPSNPKVTLNLQIIGEDDPECLFTLEMMPAGVTYSAGSKIEVRKIKGLAQEETTKFNIIKDGDRIAASGPIIPGDLVMAMQKGDDQSEDGLVYLAAYGKE